MKRVDICGHENTSWGGKFAFGNGLKIPICGTNADFYSCGRVRYASFRDEQKKRGFERHHLVKNSNKAIKSTLVEPGTVKVLTIVSAERGHKVLLRRNSSLQSYATSWNLQGMGFQMS